MDKRSINRMEHRLAKLEARLITSEANCGAWEQTAQAQYTRMRELESERDRLREALVLSELRCRNYEDILKAADMNAALEVK